MSRTIQKFLNEYLDGFRRQSAEAMALSHALPTVVASHGDQRTLSQREELVDFCQRTIDQYAREGFKAERFTVRSLTTLGADFAVAVVAWSMLASDHGMRTLQLSYNLRRDSGDWQIWAVTIFEEPKT